MPQRSPGAVRILAVFAQAEDRNSLFELFRDFRWKSHFVDNSTGLRDAFSEFRPNVIMTDSALPEGESWKDVLRSAHERSGGVPVIVGSRLADERLWAEVLNLGGYDLLVKPFIAAEVRNVINSACRSHQHRSGLVETPPLMQCAG